MEKYVTLDEFEKLDEKEKEEYSEVCGAICPFLKRQCLYNHCGLWHRDMEFCSIYVLSWIQGELTELKDTIENFKLGFK